MHNLLNKYLTPTFNANGLGGGGGMQMPSFGDSGGDAGFVDDQGGQQGDLILPGGGGEGGEDEDDMSEFLKMFADPENQDDDDDDDQGNGGDIEQQEVVGLENEIKGLIANMRFPDNAFPENFDPNDRAQLQQVMSRGIQAAVGQSLNVVFKPVQLAMKQMVTQMNATIDQRVAAARDGMDSRTILESIVPEVTNDKYSAMITSMDATLAGKGKKPKERATAIRKMLNQMGIVNKGGDSGGGSANRRMSGGGGGGGGTQPTMRKGHAALDSFFGKFDFSGGTGGGNQNGNNGRQQQNNGGQNQNRR